MLLTLTKLVAPVMPFLAEEMYQNLANFGVDAKEQPGSVHHCAYPQVDEAMVDRQLLRDTALIQKVVGLGRAARNASGVKVRQPLRQMVVRAPSKEDEEALSRLEPQVLEELNVKRMVVTSQVGDLITYVIKPNLPVLGPKYGKKLGAIRAWLASADPAQVASQVEAGSNISIEDGEGGAIELLPEELLVETREREGFAAAQEGGLVVAFDTQLDDDLIAEGIARDLVRIINDMRKSAGFDVSDRITLRYRLVSGEDSVDARHVRDALARHRDYISAETLANELVEGEGMERSYSQREEFGATSVQLAVEREDVGQK